MAKKLPIQTTSDDNGPLPAGDFAKWVDVTRNANATDGADVDVVCGDCRACCRSSFFIHIGPSETGALARIPKALHFKAPGLPVGHVLMGFRDDGSCPMLVDGNCSIYEDRPITCRQYDCRVYPAAGIWPDEPEKAGILKQAKRWAFTLNGRRAKKEFAAIQAAGRFLVENRTAFPAGVLPPNATQLAMLALRVSVLFVPPPDDKSAIPNVTVSDVVKLLRAREHDRARV